MSTIAIVGSRGWEDHRSVWRFVDQLPRSTVIVTGGAAGVDSLVEQVASWWVIEILVVRRGTTCQRNEKIAAKCDGMMAFWDGKSWGTMHAVGCARKLGKPVWIWRAEHGASG